MRKGKDCFAIESNEDFALRFISPLFLILVSPRKDPKLKEARAKFLRWEHYLRFGFFRRVHSQT